jgi:hypothetical protein
VASRSPTDHTGKSGQRWMVKFVHLTPAVRLRQGLQHARPLLG